VSAKYSLDIGDNVPEVLGVTEDEAIQIGAKMVRDYHAWGGEDECGSGLTVMLGKGRLLCLHRDEDDHTKFTLEIESA
jgi:hypothetical protein